MPDTGAFTHFAPCLLDLQEVKEGLDLRGEVADGHLVKCTARGIVEVNIIASHLCSRMEEVPIFCHCLCQ
jgi:hypothetical protein